MISIETMDGELVKVLSNVTNSHYGIHELFGFTSYEKAGERERLRLKQGYDFHRNKWFCNFQIKTTKNNSFEIINLENCSSERIDSCHWKINTPIGNFKLCSNSSSNINSILTDNIDQGKWSLRAVELFFLISFLLVPLL